MYFEKKEKIIKNDIGVGITRSMRATFSVCSPRTPQEPDFVAELVHCIPQDIYNSLKANVPGYQFAVSGAFCHQKPVADMGLSKNPEIGDLLVVYIEENKYSILKCNALLMQSKITKKTPYIVPKTEEHQLKLYEKWPDFILKRAGVYNGTVIRVQPKTLNSGAQYLLLKSPHNDEKYVSCAYPDKKLIPEKKLSEQIIDLMKFFTGRTFQIENNGGDDDWSKLILNMIRISGASRFNRRASGWINADRLTVYHGDDSILEPLNRWIDASNTISQDESISCLLIYAREEQGRSYQQELIHDSL